MILNKDQERALEIAVARYKSHEPYTVLAGPAGSGKSATLKFIIAALGLDPETDVCYAAPTGKAAQVLKKRGNPNAMTLHKLLYWAKQDKNGRYYFVPKERGDIDDYQLICVDEVSMVEPRIWQQLLSLKIPVFAMGDDHQLPPVAPEGDNHVLDNPHIVLTEIMRQEKNSEIIDFATHIRLGNPLSTYIPREEQVMVLSKSQIAGDHYMWADQIICATNRTRIQGNFDKRALLGFDPTKPCPGDSVISLKNHWDFMSNNEEPLINGSIGKILDYEVTNIWLPSYIYLDRYALMLADIETEDGEIYREVPIDYNCLITGTKTLTEKQEMQLKKCKRYEGPIPFELNYSYFATCWKFQGDQAGKILLFEEGFPYDWDTHRRYIYTGATRAVNKLVVVKK